MEEQVIKIFSDTTGKDVSELSPETLLEEDLELKSLHKFTLFAMLEGVLGSAPDTEEAGSMSTIRDFIDFYEQ